ncbi:hypothetical protein JTB14_030507 [Gonioctena quinquepunctata]|nr:hypothetical protein JTB14_030507 [Gonioctena quinquepunctata]
MDQCNFLPILSKNHLNCNREVDIG